MPDLFTIESDALPTGTVVAAFEGVEGLSQLYRFEVGLIVQDGEEIDLDEATAAAAKLSIDTGEGNPPQLFHGVLAAVELVHAWLDHALYRAVLVPHWWTATLTHHSRVFVDMTTPQIIEEVLKASAISDYELKLEASYETLPHVCQYQESNYAFVARWLEREGMYYYFEQTDSGEKLIITDNHSVHQPLTQKPVRYVAGMDEDAMALEALSSFACRRNMLPAEATLTDYNYMLPSLALKGRDDIDGSGALVMYGQNFRSQTDGGRLATVRAQQQLCRRKVYHGRGRVFNLRTGYKFTLQEHPQSSMNASYLCTELKHYGNQAIASEAIKKLLHIDTDETYAVELTAIAESVQFRPERKTPIPRIDGVLHALVDGAADSGFAQLDEEGRYHVRLKLDESGYSDGNASMWVRMMQFHAGGTEGVHFPLRKGTEVMLIFLGGDPDRPVICGAVPNPQKPSPVTSNNHTMNILVTGGSNYIAMQDASQKQWIDISTPPFHTFMHLGYTHDEHTHEIILNTDANCLFNIRTHQDIEIGGDLWEHVIGCVQEYYEVDQDSEVVGDQSLEVGGDRDIEVVGDQTVEIGGDFDTEVVGDITLEGSSDYDIELVGDFSFENQGDYDVEVEGDVTFENQGDYDVEVKGDITFENNGDYSVGTKATGEITFENHGAFAIDASGNFDGKFGGDWVCEITGEKKEEVLGDIEWFEFGNEFKITIGSKEEITLSAEMAMKASMALEIKAGIAIELDMSAKIEVEAGVKLKNFTNNIAAGLGIQLENLTGIKMENAAMHIVA